MRLIATGFVLFLVVSGCSSDTPAPPENKVDETTLLQQAWQEFEGGQYDKAISLFTELFNGASSSETRGEALSGRAWSQSYKRVFEKAKSDYAFALGLAGIAPQTKNDLRVGYALVLNAVNDFSGAVTFASAALAEKPAYSFPHDSKISVKRIRLLLAQSYYATGQFPLAAAQMDLFNPAAAPHSTDPPILLQKITAAYNSL